MDTRDFHTARGYQLLGRERTGLTASLEDYLEMICRNILSDGYVRVNTLANELNVQPPSASKMIRKLAQLKLIDYEKYGVIRLTESGRELGEYLLWRHDTIIRFFQLISKNRTDDAFMEAELTEHILSRSTVENLDRLMRLFDENPSFYSKLQESIL